MSGRGLTWYKRDPIRFLDGVQGMGPELIGAYAVILDLIYARDGEILRDDRHLSGVLGCSVRKARTLTDALIERGKIEPRGDKLTQKIAEASVKQSRTERETRANAQRKRRENEAGCNKNSSLKDKPEVTKPPREDKIREDTIANAIDGNAVDATSDAIWKRGVPFLIERHVPEQKARSMIGKWLAQSGAPKLFEALKDAAASPTEDPIPYITKILSKPEQPSTREMVEAAMRRVSEA